MENKELSITWNRIVTTLRAKTSPQQYKTWLTGVKPVRIDDSAVVLEVASSQQREHLEKYYAESILHAVETVLEKRPFLYFTVDKSRKTFIGQVSSTDAQPQVDVPRGGSAFYGSPDIILNRNYTFSNFVVGPSNRLAHAAGLAIAENLSQVYNPLFVHGSVGLGKTHLLQAICQRLLKNNDNITILYLSCESFINHFITAVKKGELDNFRYKYRHVDVLLVDDIHNLSGKEGTQEEFFHTFNTLYNAQKQIVLSSDSPPKEIPQLEERLVSRFKWGLETRLDAPDFETRMRILQHKAKSVGYEIPKEVLELLAGNIDSNIRELEGAITTVIGYASLTNREVTLKLAKEALKDTINSTPRKISINNIQEVVCEFFNVRLSDLQGKKRSKSIVFPRQTAMYFARNLTDLSLQEVGSYFGGRDHTTVMHATEKIKDQVVRDDRLRATLGNLEKKIKESASLTSFNKMS